MHDLITALGLVLVIEGALYALFPQGMKELMARAQSIPAAQLRVAGLMAAALGFGLVAAIRGF